MKTSRKRQFYTDESCEQALLVLRAHPDKTQAQVDVLLREMDLPRMQAVWLRGKSSPVISALFNQVTAARAGIKFSDLAYAAALQRLKENPLSKFEDLLPPGDAAVASFTAVRERANRDRAFKASYAVAMSIRSEARRAAPVDLSRRAHTDDEVSAAINYLRSNPGRRLVDLSLELQRLGLPSLKYIYEAKARDRRLAEQYAALSVDRGVKRYTPEAQAEALDILRNNPSTARKILKQSAGRLPGITAIFCKAKRDADVAAVYEESRSARRAHFAELRLSRRLNRSKRAPRAKRPIYKINVLRSGLLLNELYLEASNAIPHGPDRDSRDDMISEVVLRVLDGRLERSDIPKKAKSIGWAFVNLMNDRRTDTLDRPISAEYGDVMVVDTLTTDEWCSEDAI